MLDLLFMPVVPPSLQLPTDLSDSDETLEQFYTEDKKSCLQLLCDSTASSDQLQNECIQQYTMLVSANIDMDDRVSNKSSPLMSTSLSGNRFFCPGEHLAIRRAPDVI